MAPTATRRKKKVAALATLPTMDRMKRNPVLLRNKFRQKLEAKTQALRKTLSLWKIAKRTNHVVRKANDKIHMRVVTAYDAYSITKKYKKSCKEVIDLFSLWNDEPADAALMKLDPKLRPVLALRLDRWRKRVAETEWFKAYEESEPTKHDRRRIEEKERKVREMKASIEAFKKVGAILPSLDALPAKGAKAAIIELLCPAMVESNQPIPQQKPIDSVSSDDDILSENESDYDPFADMSD